MPTAARVPSSANRFAVIVGVCHYPNLVDSDAVGADWDAYAWVAMAENLGCPVENLTLLVSSPPGTHREGAGGVDPARGSATGASILAAIRALVGSLRADPTAHGILFFAGHGTDDGGGFALCPADTARVDGDLTGTISATTLLDTIGDDLPGLTVVLDACFAGAVGAVEWDGAPPAPSRTLAGPPTATTLAALHDAHVQLGRKVVLLTACRPEEQAFAYSIRPNILAPSIPHGVLTAAVSALMQRWTPPGSDQAVPYPISYGTIQQLAGAFATSLQFPQHPQVYPRSALALRAFENTRGGTLASPPEVPGWELSGGNTDAVVGLYNYGTVARGMVIDCPVYPGFFWSNNQPATGATVGALSGLNLAGPTAFNPTSGTKGATGVWTGTYCFAGGQPSTSSATPCTIIGIRVSGNYAGFLVLAAGAWTWFFNGTTLPGGTTGFALAMPDMGRVLSAGLQYPLVFRNVPGAWTQVSPPGVLPAPNGSRYFLYLTGNICVGCVDFSATFSTTWYYWGGGTLPAQSNPFVISNAVEVSFIQPATAPSPTAGNVINVSTDTN